MPNSSLFLFFPSSAVFLFFCFSLFFQSFPLFYFFHYFLLSLFPYFFSFSFFKQVSCSEAMKTRAPPQKHYNTKRFSSALKALGSPFYDYDDCGIFVTTSKFIYNGIGSI
jgi:hypothetical protein